MHQILSLLSRLTATPPATFSTYESEGKSEATRRAERAMYIAAGVVGFFLSAVVVIGAVMIYYESHYDDVTVFPSYDKLKFAMGVSALMLGQAVINYNQKRAAVYAHIATHHTNNVVGQLTNNAQMAVRTAEQAAEESRQAARLAVEKAEAVAKETLAEIKRQIEPLVSATNGNMKERLDQVFEKAKQAFATTPSGDFPGTMQQLEQMMDNRCGQIAMSAARLAVRENMDELRKAGVIT